MKGVKQFETRSWPTRYRGPLAIHAAKNFPGWAFGFYANECWELREEGFVPPIGAILGTCELVDCQPTSQVVNEISDRERKYGDYSPGRFAFHLVNVKALATPIPYKGHLGLWDYPGPL